MAARSRPEVPVPLRALTIGDRLDGALRILKLAPATVITLAAVAVVPVQLLAATLLRNAPSASLEAVFGRPLVTLFVDDLGGRTGVALFLVLLDSLSVSFVAVGLVSLVTGWHLGVRRPTADVLRAASSRLPAVAAVWVLVHLAEVAFGLVFVLTALLPMTWFAVAAPVLGAEGHGPWTTLGRSFHLTKRAFPLVLGTCLLVALVDVVLRFTLTAVGGFYVDAGWPAGWAVSTAVALGARLVTVPFVAGCAVLLYLDLRVRLEGLDIELAAADRFPVAG